MRHLFNVAEQLVLFLKPICTILVKTVLDELSYLVRSDDKNLAILYDWSEHAYSDSQQNGRGVTSILSTILMMPFKVVVGTVQLIPISTFINGTKELVRIPVGYAKKISVVQSIITATSTVTKIISDKVWNFSKVSVFPRLDYLASEIKKYNLVPSVVVKYISEVQTYYYINKWLGMA